MLNIKKKTTSNLELEGCVIAAVLYSKKKKKVSEIW